MQEIKRAKRLSQDFVQFVTARASLFTANLPQFSSVFNLFSEMRPILFNCWTHIACTSKCFSLCALVQAVAWWLWRCCCPSRLKFWTVVQSGVPASVSRTTLPCNLSSWPWPLTRLRTAILLPVWQTNVELWSTDRLPTLLQTWSTLSLGLQTGLHPRSHGWRRPAFPPKGNSVHIADVLWNNARFSSILSLRLWWVLLPLSWFPSYWRQCRSVFLSYTDWCQHLIGTLDVPADPTFQSPRGCSPVLSIQEWPSTCNDSSPVHQTNLSHTFDPTQNATQNHPHWCDVWENEFHSVAQVFKLTISAFFTKKWFLNSSANNSKLDVNPHTRKSSPCCSKSDLSQNRL